MNKITFCFLFLCASFFANAQCTISPFIQQNYEFDAKILALREIRSDANDPDYDNPYIPQGRIDYHLERLSAIYENPANSSSVDSIFNQFQFHVHLENQFASYKRIRFTIPTSVSWVQNLIDTGTSGFAPLDNFMSQYQFTYTSHWSASVNGYTYFTLTSNDFLNVQALANELGSIQDVINAFGLPPNNGDDEFYNYSGVFYLLAGLPTRACDITFLENNRYEFTLYGGDCLPVCSDTESRYVTVSGDCSALIFSPTLSTEDSELTNVAIYPNPASDNLYIKGITNIQTVEMYSILGKKIVVSLDNLTTVDVSSLKNGVYFLKVIDSQNRSVIRKFIKK